MINRDAPKKRLSERRPKNLHPSTLIPVVNPKHSISFCPVCGAGLCSVRVCHGPLDRRLPDDDPLSDPPPPAHRDHGLVVCDECEAIWLTPNTESAHQYPDPEDARCPICQLSLWGPSSHWASMAEIESLGWTHAIDRTLDGELPWGSDEVIV